MVETPAVSKELIEYLEKTCPDSSPDINDADRAIWFKAGKVSLVRHLRTAFDHQQQTILEGE